jgi:tRNA A-37 threonylcarbamoyl transferase component Bud32
MPAPCDNLVRQMDEDFSRATMTKLQELLNQQASLNQQISAIRTAERVRAISDVRKQGLKAPLLGTAGLSTIA